MKLKYTIKCFKSDKSQITLSNNFVEEIMLLKKSSNIFIVRIELKHRYFEIDGHSASENSQGIIFSYKLKPHDESDQPDYTIMIDLNHLPSEKYNMVTDRNKNTLDLIFIKKSKETLLEQKKLKPRK